MNKLDFLRPKPFKFRGGKAFRDSKGLKVNTDGTTIKDRKPLLVICQNHADKKRPPIRSWVSRDVGQAVRDGQGWYWRS